MKIWYGHEKKICSFCANGSDLCTYTYHIVKSKSKFENNQPQGVFGVFTHKKGYMGPLKFGMATKKKFAVFAQMAPEYDL